MNLKKENQREVELVRERLLLIMRQVIAHHPGVKEKQQFAKKIGTIPPTISRWEKGRGLPTLANCIAACREFKIDPAYLFLGQKNGALTGEINSRMEALEESVRHLQKRSKKGSKT